MIINTLEKLIFPTLCFLLYQFIPLAAPEWHSISIFSIESVLYIKRTQYKSKRNKHLVIPASFTYPADIFTFNQRCFNVMLLHLNNVEFWSQMKVEATLKLLRCFNVIFQRLNNGEFWLQVKVEATLKLLRCFNVIFQRLNNGEFWLHMKVEATFML